MNQRVELIKSGGKPKRQRNHGVNQRFKTIKPGCKSERESNQGVKKNKTDQDEYQRTSNQVVNQRDNNNQGVIKRDKNYQGVNQRVEPIKSGCELESQNNQTRV